MSFSQIQKITNVSGLANYNLGSKISIDGYYVLVGESGNEVAHLYKRNTSESWQLITTFDPSYSGFGSEVVIQKNYVAIGAENYTSSQGAVVVYMDDLTDSWSNSTTIQAVDKENGDKFGASLDIDGVYMVVGAPNKNSNKGVAYVYQRGDNGNVWSLVDTLTPTLQNSNDYFGTSVSISGTTVVVGASGVNANKGAVYVYTLNAVTEEWEETKKIFASDGSEGDQFGGAVSISSNHFAAGAKFKTSSDGDAFAGAVYLYKLATTWYEIDKIEGTGESDYSGNNFGASLHLNEDYLIVGSPEARGYGVVDIFYKKRSWSHLSKIVPSDVETDDSFGSSVAISYPFSAIGSPSEDDIASNAGAFYIFEDPQILVRLAQEFEVNSEFVPTKASIYLKRVGNNYADFWPIYNTQKTVIDATNFSTLTIGGNRVHLDDSVGGFTGNGYMVLDDDSFTPFSTINYPVRAIESGTFNLWIRCISLESSTFRAEILIDGSISKTIEEIVENPSALQWSWISTTIVLPDISTHVLGIRMKEKRCAIDKIYIDAATTSPYSEGPECTLSPYATIHMRLYSSNGEPSNPLFVYDYKNTITDIIQDDWYNFNINVMNNKYGYTEASEFHGNYFLVLSSSGGDSDNFVIWEMVDNDEYMSLPSAIRI